VDLLKEIGNVFTQCGVLSAFLMGIVIYLAKLIADERSARERDRLVAKEEGKERAEALEDLARSLSTLAVAIAEIRGHLFRSRL